jgi:hypothetical protein
MLLSCRLGSRWRCHRPHRLLLLLLPRRSTRPRLLKLNMLPLSWRFTHI